MCNRTPKRGETWMFRRSSDLASKRLEIAGGRVENINRHGVDFKPPGVGEIAVPSIFWEAGWEPFLCLDEGEAQEQPTASEPLADWERDLLADLRAQPMRGEIAWDVITDDLAELNALRRVCLEYGVWAVPGERTLPQRLADKLHGRAK